MVTGKSATMTRTRKTSATVAGKPAPKPTPPKGTNAAPKPTPPPKPSGKVPAPRAPRIAPEVREPRVTTFVTRSGPNGNGTTVVTRPNSMRLKGHAWAPAKVVEGGKEYRCRCGYVEGVAATDAEGRDLHQKHLREQKAAGAAS